MSDPLVPLEGHTLGRPDPVRQRQEAAQRAGNEHAPATQFVHIILCAIAHQTV